jgi:hypothetical protein
MKPLVRHYFNFTSWLFYLAGLVLFVNFMVYRDSLDLIGGGIAFIVGRLSWLYSHPSPSPCESGKAVCRGNK